MTYRIRSQVWYEATLRARVPIAAYIVRDVVVRDEALEEGCADSGTLLLEGHP